MTIHKRKWIKCLIHIGLLSLFFLGIYFAWKHHEVMRRLLSIVPLPQIDIGNLAEAIIFLTFILYVFRLLKKLILKWVEKYPKEDKSAYYSLIKLLEYIGWALALWGCLSLIGIKLQKLAIILGALSVGIGFGLQNIFNNFFSGILILFERPISVGDWIRVDGQEGIVKNIHIRSTELETFDKCFVAIPNSTILSGNVVNVTRPKEGRVNLTIGVSYNSDMHLVQKILTKCAKELPYAKKSVEPTILMREFADSSVNFLIWVVIERAMDVFVAQHDLMFAIWDAFKENNIEIPFPQQVVHLEK